MTTPTVLGLGRVMLMFEDPAGGRCGHRSPVPGCTPRFEHEEG